MRSHQSFSVDSPRYPFSWTNIGRGLWDFVVLFVCFSNRFYYFPQMPHFATFPWPGVAGGSHSAPCVRAGHIF